MLALQNQPQTGNTVDDRLLRLGSERLVSGGAALGREREREPELVSQGDMEPEPELVSQGDLEPEPEPTQTTGSPETMLDEKEDGSATETRPVDADDAPDTTTEALAAETQSDVTGEESQGTPSGDQSGDQSEPQSEGEQSEGEQSEPQSDGSVSETGETQDTSTLGEPEEPPVFEGTPGGLVENGQPTFDSRLSDEMERFRHKSFEADVLAAAAGEDAIGAASAYIFGADEASSGDGLGISPSGSGDTSASTDPVDLLAIAMRDDPVINAYLPPTLLGFDMLADGWFHQPTTPRGGGKNKFKVCIDQGAKSWDSAYAVGLDNLFRGGVCFDEVTEDNCDDADVVIFNEGVFLWGGGHRNAQGNIELPPKSHKDQVYLYFAHEAAGTFGWELRENNVMQQFDYLGYFDRTTSAVWWPFGPTLRSMLSDFKFFTRPRKNRVPGVAWLAVDCLPLRTRILQEIGEHFPVFSLGSCQNNAQAPAGLPGRGSGDARFQDLMSTYMFYFAVENGGECPGYATEKVFLALTRGSVPIYFGDENVLATMPTPESFVDLKKFDTPTKLAARLHAIATDDAVFDSVHAWRYQDPTTWSPGFRQLIRVMSTDIKYGVCHVLQKGTDVYPAAAAQNECDFDFSVMGQRVDAWPDHGAIKNPLEHFSKTCEEAREECWTFKEPERYSVEEGVTPASEFTQGERDAGDTNAGDTTTGDSIAGDTNAGDTTTGDSIAGDTTPSTVQDASSGGVEKNEDEINRRARAFL